MRIKEMEERINLLAFSSLHFHCFYHFLHFSCSIHNIFRTSLFFLLFSIFSFFSLASPPLYSVPLFFHLFFSFSSLMVPALSTYTHTYIVCSGHLSNGGRHLWEAGSTTHIMFTSSSSTQKKEERMEDKGGRCPFVFFHLSLLYFLPCSA